MFSHYTLYQKLNAIRSSYIKCGKSVSYFFTNSMKCLIFCTTIYVETYVGEMFANDTYLAFWGKSFTIPQCTVDLTANKNIPR